MDLCTGWVLFASRVDTSMRAGHRRSFISTCKNVYEIVNFCEILTGKKIASELEHTCLPASWWDRCTREICSQSALRSSLRGLLCPLGREPCPLPCLAREQAVKWSWAAIAKQQPAQEGLNCGRMPPTSILPLSWMVGGWGWHSPSSPQRRRAPAPGTTWGNLEVGDNLLPQHGSLSAGSLPAVAQLSPAPGDSSASRNAPPLMLLSWLMWGEDDPLQGHYRAPRELIPGQAIMKRMLSLLPSPLERGRESREDCGTLDVLHTWEKRTAVQVRPSS